MNPGLYIPFTALGGYVQQSQQLKSQQQSSSQQPQLQKQQFQAQQQQYQQQQENDPQHFTQHNRRSPVTVRRFRKCLEPPPEESEVYFCSTTRPSSYHDIEHKPALVPEDEVDKLMRQWTTLDVSEYVQQGI